MPTMPCRRSLWICVLAAADPEVILRVRERALLVITPVNSPAAEMSKADTL